MGATDARSHFHLPNVPPLAKTQPCSQDVHSHWQRLPTPVRLKLKLKLIDKKNIYYRQPWWISILKLKTSSVTSKSICVWFIRGPVRNRNHVESMVDLWWNRKPTITLWTAPAMDYGWSPIDPKIETYSPHRSMDICESSNFRELLNDTGEWTITRGN